MAKPAAPTPTAVYRCRESFAYFVNGSPHVVPAGTLFSGDHEAVRNNPGAFVSVSEHVAEAAARLSASRVEQATAAPGEVRAAVVPEPAPEPEA